MTRLFPFVVVVTCLALAGCPRAIKGLKKGAKEKSQSEATAEAAEHDPFAVSEDGEAGPDEAKYLQAAKPFYVAINERKYDVAYDLLSPHALHDVHPYQFKGPDDPDEAKAKEPPRIAQLSKEEFVKRMKEVEALFGPPKTIEYVSVDEIDPKVLSGKGDRLSVMFAIGMMPESVPVEIRKAALRGQIRCEFTPEAKKKVMEQYEMTAEELDDPDNDIHPYFKVKTVLLEENGDLKVGYFEFVPPSILD